MDLTTYWWMIPLGVAFFFGLCAVVMEVVHSIRRRRKPKIGFRPPETSSVKL